MKKNNKINNNECKPAGVPRIMVLGGLKEWQGRCANVWRSAVFRVSTIRGI